MNHRTLKTFKGGLTQHFRVTQVNSTMTSQLQLCELIELIIKIELKQHKYKGCTTNIMKESETSDEDKEDKFKFHKQDNIVTKSNIKDLYA